MPTEATTQARESVQQQVIDRVDSTKSAGSPDRIRVVASGMREALQQRRQRDVLEAARGTLGVNQEQRDNMIGLFSDATKKNAARDVGNRIDTVNNFVREGYDRLPLAEQQRRRGEVTTALQNSAVMGEYMRGLTGTPAEIAAAQDALAEGVLQDEHLQGLVNKNLQKIAKMKFNPKPKEIEARKKAIDAQLGTSGKTDDATATAALKDDWQKAVQRKSDNVIGDSVHEMIRSNLDTAEEVVVTNGKELDAKVDEEWMKGISDNLERRWSSRSNPKALQKSNIFGREDGAVRSDWNQFLDQGLDGLPTLNNQVKDYLNARPELKQKFEAQIGEQLMFKRLRAGLLKRDDCSALIDAKWLGGTQEERVDKIRNIVFEQHAGYKQIVSELQGAGISEKEVWDKIKAAGPGAAAGGLLAALLMMFGLPSAAIVGGALKLGIGAAAGGAVVAGGAYAKEQFK